MVGVVPICRLPLMKVLPLACCTENVVVGVLSCTVSRPFTVVDPVIDVVAPVIDTSNSINTLELAVSTRNLVAAAENEPFTTVLPLGVDTVKASVATVTSPARLRVPV